MSRLHQDAPVGLWMCTELFTECPDCGEHITEPAGELDKFLALLVAHENAGCTPQPDDREKRCPDGGYCHGSTIAAGSPPCPAGACYRVAWAGPLSGVYPDDRWPAEVLAANRQAEPATGEGE